MPGPDLAPTQPAGGTSGALDVGNPSFQPSEMPPDLTPRVDEDRCTSTDIETRRITPSVMLVVDGSTSMEDTYGDQVADGGMPIPGPERWTSVRDALVGPDGVVPVLQDLVKFGLALFATQGGCPLPFGIVQPALNNMSSIESGLPGAPPGVYTPAGAALNQVVQMLPDPTTAGPDMEIEPQVIILATDGNPNDCSAFGQPEPNFQPSIDAALLAQSKHQKLYVISVGMDAFADHLQEMANIGAGMDRYADPGAPVYYPEDPIALASTLETLIGAELSCDVVLDGKGVRPGKECDGTVLLNGDPLECNGDNGYELSDPLHITLKGSACDIYKASASAVLNANFPCDALVE